MLLISLFRIICVSLIIILFLPSSATAKCIAKWSEVEKLAGNLKGLNLSQVKESGSIEFGVKNSSGESGTYTLVNSRDRILARTPEGNAAVELCPHGSGVKAVANLGLFGKKEAAITSMGGGNFQIKTKTDVYRAAVR